MVIQKSGVQWDSGNESVRNKGAVDKGGQTVDGTEL